MSVNSDYMTRDLNADLRLVDGGVSAAQGFLSGSVSCGIKTEAGAPDLSMLTAEVPCTCAAMFTTSRTAAHTVRVCREHLASTESHAQAVVVNSGNANCSNGEQGYRDAIRMAELTAAKLGIGDPGLVLVSSTGIIGRPLPMDHVEQGISRVAPSAAGGADFARGIMTTDTRPKTVAVEFEAGGKLVRLGGSTKGVGMIYPNMATMLCFLTTDAAVDPAYLQKTMRDAVNDSFNMVCVDGDMSTNDSAIILANGLAGNQPLHQGVPGADTFAVALRYATRYLAREMARDGEGATKLMIVNVRGAPNDAQARIAARAITNSAIWKCALAGGDPNWGRLIAALGASGAQIQHEKLDIHIGGVPIVAGGLGAAYDQAAAKEAMAGADVTIDIDLNLGEHGATAWGCDLTHGYIDENATYTR